MNRPVSPPTVMTPQYFEQLETNDISLEEFNLAVSHGFTYIQSKKNGESITPGDILLEYLNYNHDENNPDDKYVPLFCLSVCMLHKMRETIDNIHVGTTDKLITYCINKFNETM
mgnify:CR=1 FL=1|tara:strand:+ start:9 stop:350 length:342 start_codon:yes stop_codon:yes gene_type:complete